jgi:hypothetical protein
MAAEALLDGEAEALTRKAVELALAGDTVALRLCLERLLPPRRSRRVTFDSDHPNGGGSVAGLCRGRDRHGRGSAGPG